jgi:hypothetical protein
MGIVSPPVLENLETEFEYKVIGVLLTRSAIRRVKLAIFHSVKPTFVFAIIAITTTVNDKLYTGASGTPKNPRLTSIATHKCVGTFFILISTSARITNKIKIQREKRVEDRNEELNDLVLQTSADENAQAIRRKNPTIEMEYPAIEFE